MSELGNPEVRPRKKYGRREFLTKFGGGAAALALLSGIKASTGEEDQLQTHIENWSYPHQENVEVVFSKNQLFVNGNPRLQPENIVPHKTAYVFTHFGYTEYALHNVIESAKKRGENAVDIKNPDAVLAVAKKAYGDYLKYLDNISKLSKRVRDSGSLVIYAAEERDFYNPAIPRPELRPSSDNFIAVTHDSTGEFINGSLNTLDGNENQNPELLFEFLRNTGVQEVRIAGEFAYNDFRYSPHAPLLGCMGGVAAKLHEENFNVRGIEGCVYPSSEPEKRHLDFLVLRNIYKNQIPLQTVIETP